MHWSLKRRLLPILIVAVSYGCGGAAGPSTYKVVVPEWTVAPRKIPCVITRKDGTKEMAVCYKALKSDVDRIISKLKAACINNGQSRKDCQVE